MREFYVFTRDETGAIVVDRAGERMSASTFLGWRQGGLYRSNCGANKEPVWLLHAGSSPFGHTNFIEITEEECRTLSRTTSIPIRGR